MSNKLVYAVASALVIASASHGAQRARVARPTTSPMLTQAKALIAGRMVDPSSLQYRNLRMVRETILGQPLNIACGEFNSKNRMGGYVGFQTFAYEPTQMRGAMTFDGSKFDLITSDGRDLATDGAFAERNARILSVCLGLPQ